MMTLIVSAWWAGAYTPYHAISIWYARASHFYLVVFACRQFFCVNGSQFLGHRSLASIFISTAYMLSSPKNNTSFLGNILCRTASHTLHSNQQPHLTCTLRCVCVCGRAVSHFHAPVSEWLTWIAVVRPYYLQNVHQMDERNEYCKSYSQQTTTLHLVVLIIKHKFISANSRAERQNDKHINAPSTFWNDWLSGGYIYNIYGIKLWKETGLWHPRAWRGDTV